MKAQLYDYREMVDGRPKAGTVDVHPDLEFYFGVLLRKDWAVALKQEQGGPCILGIVDVMTDIFVNERTMFPGMEILDGLRQMATDDFPVLDARLRAAIEKAPDPTFHESGGDE